MAARRPQTCVSFIMHQACQCKMRLQNFNDDLTSCMQGLHVLQWWLCFAQFDLEDGDTIEAQTHQVGG
jgi:hypothetical protein